ncbi:kinesin-like protein KIF21A isoform X2 [Onthophagus taurus]|uniref:kinesin-like protein KIF21A isoform X2 n=1 Tax=Onthophagus taurus TaxID=166361 RepID=UPI000C1FE093|nr:kinesin-like protein KIF21A isoform X2 [Onthophagus taurus]
MEDDVSVRVAVRIRPQIPREIIDMCQVCTSVTPGEPQVRIGSDKYFTYDHVFDIGDTQDEVYGTCVEPLILSSLEGYNATVLAYGQTGSGKTYTMGSGFDVDVTPEQIGIIPRAIKQIFSEIRDTITRFQSEGRPPPEFKVSTQFMELYNEEVIDLYNPVYNKTSTYKIHEDPYGGIQIKGVTTQTVISEEETLQCLRVGALSRTTASTQMNTQSSRSHAIFTVHIKQQRLITEQEDSSGYEILSAKFHFVDLAGSERLKRTGATGDRAKEGISINCGLLALGNVISALGDKSKRATHVPYRDSKLTRLLQDSLGGNSRTVMIACVSPSDRDFMETLNTLKYANRARNIKNKVFINQDKSTRTISQLKQQIAQLQLELIEYKQGKRIIDQDGCETVNDMFYENTMLQDEVNNLRTRIKVMQETVDNLTFKNTQLLSEKAMGNWVEPDKGHLSDMIQEYVKEIEDLRTKLMEANITCDHLRKQLSRYRESAGSLRGSLDREIPSLIEEARRKLEREKDVLTRSLVEIDVSDRDSEEESENDEKEYKTKLNDELINLTNDIDMKQKLIDELELSQRRMHTMKQHYEEKLMQLTTKIKSTQEERDKVLHTYSSTHPEQSESVKKIREEYSKKISEMQKELKKLQVAQKEHARLLKSHNHNEKQLNSYKNELLDMKRAKVKLINKMKEESQRHRETESKRLKEIAQLRKESRRNESVIKTMEAQNRLKEQVLKRKQEEVSILRKIQRNKYGVLDNKIRFSEKTAKAKWRKLENSINNITLNRRGITEQEIRMDNFLEKRESLGKELEILQDRRNQMSRRGQETTALDNYIEDIQANLNYLQEKISETQQNVMEIEDSQDNDEATNLLQVVNSLSTVDEAKYLIEKLLNMTLSKTNAVAQSDAKLKENDALLHVLKQENVLRGQLLDHILHSDHLALAGQMSSSTNTGSNESSRSESPDVSQSFSLDTISPSNSKSKIRRRMAAPEEMLYGLQIQRI